MTMATGLAITTVRFSRMQRTTKLPDLPGLNGDGVRGPVLAGSVAAAIATYSLVRFLSRYFTRLFG